jgi:hypothetical protein
VVGKPSQRDHHLVAHQIVVPTQSQQVVLVVFLLVVRRLVEHPLVLHFEVRVLDQ